MKRLANTKLRMWSMWLLVCVFAVYNLIVYKTAGAECSEPFSKDAIAGKNLWQVNNCNSCHQLYGLGGYLGPDLTNVYTADGKGPGHIKGILNSGVGTMPEFHFTEKEKESIVAFLKEVDQSGHYPNYNANFHASGWVTIQYK